MTFVTYSEYGARRAQLIDRFKELRIDTFVILSLPNVRYLSGFTGSNAALLLTADRAILFTDPRYQTQAPQETDCDVKIAKGPLLKDVAVTAKRLRSKAVGFEQSRISFEEHGQLVAHLAKVRLRAALAVIEKLRQIKSAQEIEAIRRSVQVNSQALADTRGSLQAGMTELDLAASLDFRMQQLGAEGTAFGTIVASGGRSALPHAHPTRNPIPVDQLLLVDMGARVEGYCSDMTRTHAVGKLSRKARGMYKAVLESQLAAIDAVRPGATCAGVDRAARNVLRGYNLEQAFIHSTGHGLGLEIHEGPRVGRKDKTKLQPGMVITIEPGVYLEDVGGVRIEDTVAVTAAGCEVLTPTPKELVTF